MIDLIYRTQAPGYRGTATPPTARTGLLSGVWCYLFGGGTAPAYKTIDGRGATAPTVSRCWWSLTGSPQYRTPPVPPASEPEPEASPCDGAPLAEDCSCEPHVEAREIHVYPGT